ncbi:MAG: fimbrillin family protein [Phocaeicola plebeius]
MRKNLYLGLIACAALTMTGCSNDEVSYDSPKQEAHAIQFSTYLGKNVQGRGTINDDAALQNSGFGVTAFYTGQTTWTTPSKAPDFMYNQEVKYNTGWAYSPVKYWPTMKNDKISFFAYAPYSTGNTNGITLPGKSEASTPTSLTFTVNDAASGMIDFVAAQAIDKMQKDAAAGGQEAVSFAFKHELSRLALKVKTSENLTTGSHVVLKKAELIADGYTKSATYTFANTTTTADVATRGSWSNQTAMTTDYDLASIINFTAKDSEEGTTTTIGNKEYSERVREITGTEEALFTTNQYLFLIPSTDANGAGLTANTASIKFYYDIVTEDSKLNQTYSITEAEKQVFLPAGILKQGEAYNVTFTFNMDQIKVSGNITEWSSETNGGNVNVPFTPDTATAD